MRRRKKGGNPWRKGQTVTQERNVDNTDSPSVGGKATTAPQSVPLGTVVLTLYITAYPSCGPFHLLVPSWPEPELVGYGDWYWHELARMRRAYR